MLFAPNYPVTPLAERVRPKTLTQVIGQQHLLAPDSPFTRMIGSGRLSSMIFWGPPGVGKTTLAQIIAQTAKRPFRQLSAINAGVKEVREVIEFALRSPGTVLFLDEIHRFNKSQQDSLLGAVEKGLITLIGATTENPSFEVNAALLSRCSVFVLKPFEEADVQELLDYAIREDYWLQKLPIEVKETKALYALSGGDARKCLTLAELLIQSNLAPEDAPQPPIVFSDEAVMATAQTHIALYDKAGEQHYDIISAFIKSLRGGDPDGAVYWLARMLDGGEDVKFIARRMVILSSEDVGNANPNALLMANACFQAVSMIGMPEARIILSQAATYLATSAKSNAAYLAIDEALAYVKANPPFPVPLHLRNSPTKLMKNLGYGAGYKYSHDHEGNDGNQQYLPDEAVHQRFYKPKNVGSEAKIVQFMREKWGK